MPYLVFTRDVENGAHIRNEVRAAHYEYLRANAHRLIASGGVQNENGQYIGGAIIINVDTREEAEEFARNDPFAHAGLFGEVTIVRWVQAFLNFKEDKGLHPK